MHAANDKASDWQVLYASLDPTTYQVKWAKTFGGTGKDSGSFYRFSGTYLMDGATNSFGLGVPKGNIFGMILDSNGYYPACHISPIALPIGTPELTIDNPHLHLRTPPVNYKATLNPKAITLPLKAISLPAYNFCAPVN